MDTPIIWVVAVWTMFCPAGVLPPCWRHLDDAADKSVGARFATLPECIVARDRARKVIIELLGAHVPRYDTAQCRPLSWLNIPYKIGGQGLPSVEVHGSPL